MVAIVVLVVIAYIIKTKVTKNEIVHYVQLLNGGMSSNSSSRSGSSSSSSSGYSSMYRKRGLSKCNEEDFTM